MKRELRCLAMLLFDAIDLLEAVKFPGHGKISDDKGFIENV
jgi:hypothetical protein